MSFVLQYFWTFSNLFHILQKICFMYWYKIPSRMLRVDSQQGGRPRCQIRDACFCFRFRCLFVFVCLFLCHAWRDYYPLRDQHSKTTCAPFPQQGLLPHVEEVVHSKSIGWRQALLNYTADGACACKYIPSTGRCWRWSHNTTLFCFFSWVRGLLPVIILFSSDYLHCSSTNESIIMTVLVLRLD
jgi:hypothetical protein